MLEISELPHVIAGFNALTAVFIGAGYYFIRHGLRSAHRAAMLSAVGSSVGFLVSYLYYHFNITGLTQFGGDGVTRQVYFTILVLHITGAMVLVPAVPVTLFRGLTGRFDQHRKIARWTWLLWMYVAVSGVVIYAMAFHLYATA